jgi:hypothetical protein
VLLDYYFTYVLALCAMRAWDDPEPGAVLDWISELVRALRDRASGHRIVDDAETLLLLATSHYEPDERGFATLLDRARILPEKNRAALALIHAGALGPHLRFAFDVTCVRSIDAMRADNVADYPWLCFSIAEVAAAYDRAARSGDAAGAVPFAEALLNAVSADPEGMTRGLPEALSACESDRAAFARVCAEHRDALAAGFETMRPTDEGYSPLALSFNFSQNLVKGAVVDALLLGEPWPVSLNELLSSVARGPAAADRLALARTLMGYARARPDTIGGRLAPVIIYDPPTGRRWFREAMRALQ